MPCCRAKFLQMQIATCKKQLQAAGTMSRTFTCHCAGRLRPRQWTRQLAPRIVIRRPQLHTPQRSRRHPKRFGKEATPACKQHSTGVKTGEARPPRPSLCNRTATTPNQGRRLHGHTCISSHLISDLESVAEKPAKKVEGKSKLVGRCRLLPFHLNDNLQSTGDNAPVTSKFVQEKCRPLRNRTIGHGYNTVQYTSSHCL